MNERLRPGTEEPHFVSTTARRDPVAGSPVPGGEPEAQAEGRFATQALVPLPWRLRLLMTLLPASTFLAVLGWVSVAYGLGDALFLLSMGVGSFVGGGKLVILAGAIEGAPMGVWPLALLVVAGDLATALLLVANFHYLYALPWAGVRLAAARAAGARLLQNNRWMQRMARVSLVLFIAAPFQGTGAVLGVILGGMLGLTRASVIGAIVAGATLGAGSVAALGRYHQDTITDLAERPMLGGAVAGGCLILAALAGRWLVGASPKRES